MVLPIDEPPDQLYRLITHELTHIFEFDIIPRGADPARACRCGWTKGCPTTWPAYWNPLDLMTVRDAAVADIVPKMSEFEGYGSSPTAAPALQPRPRGVRVHRGEVGQGRPAAVPVLAAQERHRRRRERLRGSAQAEAGGVRRAVRAYLKERFKPFRDKERPADYGRDLAPKPEKTHVRRRVLSIEPSPSGDLIAAVAGNRKDQELDIVLLSAKDGQVIRNLTQRLRQGPRLRVHRARRAARWNMVPWMAWSPTGDRLAYFVRTEKERR